MWGCWWVLVLILMVKRISEGGFVSSSAGITASGSSDAKKKLAKAKKKMK